MELIVILILLGMALVMKGVNKSGEIADKVNTKEAHGLSFGVGCLAIPVVLLMAYFALGASLAIIPDMDRQQAREQRQGQPVVQPTVTLQTLQPAYEPVQWSNAYWQEKREARETRNAQYRP